jgi:transcriptional regulator with XRE-family HTH domain
MAGRKRKAVTIPFGGRLAKIRNLRGLTQTELGKAIGASQRMVAYYEKETQPPPSEKLHLIAKALNVTADELLGIKPIKEEDRAANRKLLKTVKRLEKLSLAEQKAVIHYINALTPRKTATS